MEDRQLEDGLLKAPWLPSVAPVTAAVRKPREHKARKLTLLSPSLGHLSPAAQMLSLPPTNSADVKRREHSTSNNTKSKKNDFTEHVLKMSASHVKGSLEKHKHSLALLCIK